MKTRGFVLALLVTVMVMVSTVDCADTLRLKTTPRGMAVADWNEYMGKWYLYAVKHSCSWSGGVKFTDWTYVMKDYRHPEFTMQDQWRKDGSCSFTKDECVVTSSGCYSVVDQVGDLWSGKAVLVDGDNMFRHYAITWGCVKYIGNACADYWYTLKTRDPNPGREIIDRANRKLAELWDTSLAEMNIVTHTKSCDSTPPATNADNRQTWRKY